MDLHSGYPFFLLKYGFVNHYEALTEDKKTDIAIIGGGISGALAAYYLTKAGRNVTVLDKRNIGMGSTCASTSILQYEIDTPFRKLTEKVGEQNAVRSLKLGIEAIQSLKRISAELGKEIEFESKKSLYVCSFKKDLNDLIQEYEARKKYGFKVEYLTSEDILSKFGFTAPGAILSLNAGQLNSYMLTHKLMKYCMSKGGLVYDKTKIVKIQHLKNSVNLTTNNGFTVNAKTLVYACGYEIGEYLDKTFATLHSTYASASEPFKESELWYENSIIWETSRPYTYMRTTKDNRVIIGGKDENFNSAIKRDSLIRHKSKQLEKEFNQYFPQLEFKTDFRWAGTFAETKDGLPYIGKYKDPRSYYILGFGGNGITFSVIAAKIIRDLVMKKPNKDANIFSFNRKQDSK